MEAAKDEPVLSVPATTINSVASMEEDWKNLKLQNSKENNESRLTNADMQLKNDNLPLPLNPDGTLSFFWFDATEENFGTDVFLFGKIWQPESN